MTRQLHAAAILTRLAAAPGSPAMVVHDDQVPPTGSAGSVPPYAVVRFVFRKLTVGESPGTTSLTFDSVTYQVDVRVHSVGADARATRGVATRAETQLLNWTPTITGRSCSPLRQVESETLGPNEAMGVTVAQQVDVYRFLSQPG